MPNRFPYLYFLRNIMLKGIVLLAGFLIDCDSSIKRKNSKGVAGGTDEATIYFVGRLFRNIYWRLRDILGIYLYVDCIISPTIDVSTYFSSPDNE